MSCCSDRLLRWALVAGLCAAGGLVSAGEPRRLTDDGRFKRDPRFIHSGDELVYVAEDGPIVISLMRLDMNTRQTRRFFPQAATSQFEPSFSADDRLMAFVELRGVTNVKLVIRSLADNQDAIFDPGSDRAHLGCPSVAPDGSRVIFSLPGGGGQQIVSVDAQGQNRRDLTQGAAMNDWATFSPDGQKIAFGSNRDGNFEIYTMRSDGSDPRRVTDQPSADFRPSWSPDGSRIAFTSNRDGDYEIYTMNADGSGIARLTDNPERDDFAKWRPGGKQLVAVSERAGEFDLYLYDVP